MIEQGAAHTGVATDHVVESYRNGLWPGYKTSAGIERALPARFQQLETAPLAMGIVTWPMTDLEADDALASAARIADADRTGREHLDADKDLAQCVRGDRVVQVDRRRKRFEMADVARRSSVSSPR
jgi:hypothetical protein